jgi:hypothetical protein
MRARASKPRLYLAAHALFVAVVPVSILAQSERGQRIDGTSLASFETSVVALQNDLSPRRREEFEVALAVIWIRNTLGSR